MTEDEFFEKKFEEWKRNAYAPKRKVSDRPHWITIVLGLLSPSLAIAALVMSYVTYKANMASTQIAQKSYVQFEGLRYSFETYEEPDTHKLVAYVEVKFKLTNLGNTPAELNYAEARFHMPDGWKPQGESFRLGTRVVDEIDREFPIARKNEWAFDSLDLSGVFVSAHQQTQELSLLRSFELSRTAWGTLNETVKHRVTKDTLNQYPLVEVISVQQDMFGNRDFMSQCIEPKSDTTSEGSFWCRILRR